MVTQKVESNGKDVASNRQQVTAGKQQATNYKVASNMRQILGYQHSL